MFWLVTCKSLVAHLPDSSPLSSCPYFILYQPHHCTSQANLSKTPIWSPQNSLMALPSSHVESKFLKMTPKDVLNMPRWPILMISWHTTLPSTQYSNSTKLGVVLWSCAPSSSLCCFLCQELLSGLPPELLLPGFAHLPSLVRSYFFSKLLSLFLSCTGYCTFISCYTFLMLSLWVVIAWLLTSSLLYQNAVWRQSLSFVWRVLLLSTAPGT